MSPVITGTPPTTVTIGETYAFRPQATDPNGDRLTFKIRNQPRWASFDCAHAASCVARRRKREATADIVIGVSDWRASVALPSFTITRRLNRARMSISRR